MSSGDRSGLIVEALRYGLWKHGFADYPGISVYTRVTVTGKMVITAIGSGTEEEFRDFSAQLQHFCNTLLRPLAFSWLNKGNKKITVEIEKEHNE